MRDKIMRRHKNLSGVASRMRILRKQNKLTVQQMASQLGKGPNGYRKYERGEYFPPLQVQVYLSENFDISLDWLLLNKGPMLRSEVEKALQENKQPKAEKMEEKTGPEPEVPPDAVIVTSPEIKELLQYMEENPLFKFQLLGHFYRHKQGAQKDGEIPFE
jgi:transcriptional regulator with XRE-family HTH domain